MKLNIDESKKFLLIVGIALGVLFLMLGYDSSVRQGAQAVARDNSQALEDLEDTMDKFLGREGIAQSRNEILKKEFLPDIKQKLEFPDDLPGPPPDLDPAVHLRQELMRLKKEAKNRAARKDVAIPERDWDIGEKIKRNNTPQEVAELRLRLSATTSVVNRCLESNVRRIRKIQHRKASIEVIEETPTVVRRLPFVVEFEGDLSSIASVMLTYQGGGGGKSNFLEVLECEISDSPGQGVLLAKIQLAALRILDRSEVKEETGEEPPEQKVPGKTPRRRPGRKRY